MTSFIGRNAPVALSRAGQSRLPGASSAAFRALSTQASSPSKASSAFAASKSRPLHRTGSHRPRAAYATTLALSLPFSFGIFSSSKPATTAEVDSKSSSLLRRADESAPRAQTITLVFCSIKGQERSSWQQYMAYFRQAGHDCLDVNLDYSPKADAKNKAEDGDEHNILAEELTSQIRLNALLRSPVAFVRGDTALPISTIHAHLHSRPNMSGLVIVSNSGSAGGDEKILEEVRKKLGGRVIVVKDTGDGMKESERFLIEQGLS